ncbi:MAG: biopolymer transporter ExbD [Lentisphaeria bacterium]|nr:biopolymer transporter ExbD [Lentisphaeria bacterium]
MALRNKKRSGGPLPVPTTSMGDIAFLLIIFFMLTSKFMQESHVEYQNAKSPDVESIEDFPISVILDSKGEIWLQGQPCGSAETMRMGVEVLRGDSKDTKVLLKIHNGATQQQYGPVIQNLAQAGVKIAFVGERSSDYSIK